MDIQILDNEWNELTQFFPDGWEDKAIELGVIERKRKFKTAGDLLRVLLIHLANGCSLKETVVLASKGDVVDVSAVALLKKLKASSEWLKWLSTEMLSNRGLRYESPSWLSDYNVKSVDASVITEPGSTGTDWRLHYSLEMFTFNCDQFIISKQDLGESLVNFEVSNNDLIIADRAYSRYKGFEYVLGRGGHFLTRFMNRAFTLYNLDGNEIVLLDLLKDLNIGEVFDKEIQIGVASKRKLPLRVCAIKNNKQVAKQGKKRAIKEQKRKQRNINKSTIEYHGYTIVLTSLPDKISAANILELYRMRWQVEISFKQLKSIFGIGHLPKFDLDSSKAWLHGKLFVALLAQRIIDEGRLFSPWGYPVKT